MVDACRAAGVRLSVVSQHRFRDAPAAAKRLIDDGAIGDVRMIRLTGAEVGWWDLAARGDAWKLDPQQQTAYASWGAHGCDLMRWFTGADGRVGFARITNFSGEPPGVGQSAAVIVRDDVRRARPGLDELRNPAARLHAVVAVADRRLDGHHRPRPVRRSPARPRRRLGNRGGAGPFDPMDASDPVRLRAYAAQLEALVAAIAADRDPLVSGAEGRNTVAMLEAAERSAASGQAEVVA